VALVLIDLMELGPGVDDGRELGVIDDPELAYDIGRVEDDALVEVLERLALLVLLQRPEEEHEQEDRHDN
jgi:hypothetical protein